MPRILMAQTRRWLLTVRESPRTWNLFATLPQGVVLEISPLRIAVTPGEDAAPPNPNCLGKLSSWPRTVELRRPDGVSRSIGLRSASAHLNIAYEARNERDEFGRIRNPWLSYAVLEGVQVEDVPIGSELWGMVGDVEAAKLDDTADQSS